MTALNQLNQLALLESIAEIDGTINAYELAYGYDPSFQYCVLTGKPIGIVASTEFGELLNLLPADGTLVDLRLRVLASMRRSMKWNKDAIANLPAMRRIHPIETMSYLLNQLFQGPKNSKMAWDAELENRIYVYEMINSWHLQYGRTLGVVSNSTWDSIMHMLIELNAKFNLGNEVAPFSAADFLNLPLESVLQTFHDRLAPWYRRRVEYHARLETQAIYHQANPGAKRAFFESWSEQKPRVAKATPKPVSEAAKKKIGDMNMLADIFDSIIALDPSAVEEGPATTQAKSPSKAAQPSRTAFTFGALVKKS
jgi:hypothetical protein